MSNKDEIYIRELSIKLFNDSKKLESLESKVKKIILEFSCQENAFKEVEDILSEFNILKNPSFINIKGKGKISVKGTIIDLNVFEYGIGINSKDIKNIEFIKNNSLSKVITIENLTTFNRFKEENALIVYLGGYHNEARRNFLKKIKNTFQNVEFYHCGDIDVGGFKIVNHLREKTGIQFKLLNMDIETIKKYKSYCKSLSENDKKSLIQLLEDSRYEELYSLINFMLNESIKLEQEIIYL